MLIGLFKLAKAILFFGIGVGAIHLLHKDLEDEVMRLALRFKFDPESRFVALLLDKVDLIDAHRLRQISVATFGYSALALTEGVGLLLEKVWAEYLTLILTISFLPWELYELARRPDWFRLSLLLINLAVLCVSGVAAAAEEAIPGRCRHFRFFFAYQMDSEDCKWLSRYEPRLPTLHVVGTCLDSASVLSFPQFNMGIPEFGAK